MDDETYLTPSGKLVRLAPRREEFQRVGHSIFAMLFALAGGIAAKSFHMIESRKSEPAP